LKSYKKEESPGNADYHLRYVAKVKLLDETPDPDGKALHRVMVSTKDAPKKLGWGKRGEVLIRLASSKNFVT